MIIQSLQGTFSVAHSESKHDELLIRSNDIQSLCRLFDKRRVNSCSDLNYSFCVSICKEELSSVLIKLVKQIDYADFDQMMNELLLDKNKVFTKVSQ